MKLIHETVGRFLRSGHHRLGTSLESRGSFPPQALWLNVCCKYIQEALHSHGWNQVPEKLVGPSDGAFEDYEISDTMLGEMDRRDKNQDLQRQEHLQEHGSPGSTKRLTFCLLQYAALYIFDHARGLEASRPSYALLRSVMVPAFLELHNRCYEPPCVWCADSRLLQQFTDQQIDLFKTPWAAAIVHGSPWYCGTAIAKQEINPPNDQDILSYALISSFSEHKGKEPSASTSMQLVSMLLKTGTAVSDNHIIIALSVTTVEILKLLLKYRPQEKVILTDPEDGRQYGPLWYLITRMYMGPDFGQVIDLLLDRGEDINSYCGRGATALHALIYL